MKVVVLCGGPSSEYDVSLSTAEGIIGNIDSKHQLQILLMGKDYKSVLFKPVGNRKTFPKAKDELGVSLKKISKDSVVFIAMHGEFGEDGVIQSILENLRIKYTGSDSRASIIGMNKYATYQILEGKVDVEFPKVYSIEKLLSGKHKHYNFPLVLKPVNMGSSVGVNIALNKEELNSALLGLKRDYSGIYFMMQECIDDSVEISCGCLEKKNGEFLELPPIEIQPQVSKFYSYKAKYEQGGSNHKVPPVSIEKTLQDRISSIACKIHKIIGCKTYSRSDFIVKGKKIYFLEVNTLPGLTRTSLIPEEVQAIGMNYTQLLNFIIENS